MTRALLLVAHGSRDPRAAPVAHEVAAAAGRATGVEARAAFLELTEPSPGSALDRLAAHGVDDVTVQPFLLSHAYHSKVDLPAVTALVDARGWTSRLGGVLGPDDLLVEALVRRLREAADATGGGGGQAYDGVVLAAAGSTDPDANRAVRSVATTLGARLRCPAVPGFASAAPPRIGEAVQRLRESGLAHVAVATYLLAPGHFSDRVRADAIEAGAVAVADPLGAAPEVIDLVRRRAHIP